MTFQPRSDISERTRPADLIAYIGDLEAKMQALTSALAPAAVVAHLQLAFGLTGKEAELLSLLSEGKPKTREQVIDAIYWRQRDTPEPKIIDVFMCRLRNKVGPYGIVIETIYGGGYRLVTTDIVFEAMATGKADLVPGAVAPVLKTRQNAIAQPYGSVLEKARTVLRGRIDDTGVVRISGQMLSAAMGVGTAGASFIRQLEDKGELKVVEKPSKGAPWVLRLRAAA